MVTIAVNLPGPAAAARFVELGASVVRSSRRRGPARVGRADVLRRAGRWPGGPGSRPQGRRRPARLEVLLADADLLLSSHRTSAPGAARARLGCRPCAAPSALPGRDRRPPGARDDVPGHDLTYQADLGLLTLRCRPGPAGRPVGGRTGRQRGPGRPGPARRDGRGVIRCRCRWTRRQRSWRGRCDTGCPAPGTLLGGAVPGYGLYRSSDGWLAVAALEPHFLRRLTEALEVTGTADELAARLRHANQRAVAGVGGAAGHPDRRGALRALRPPARWPSRRSRPGRSRPARTPGPPWRPRH